MLRRAPVISLRDLRRATVNETLIGCLEKRHPVAPRMTCKLLMARDATRLPGRPSGIRGGGRRRMQVLVLEALIVWLWCCVLPGEPARFDPRFQRPRGSFPFDTRQTSIIV